MQPDKLPDKSPGSFFLVVAGSRGLTRYRDNTRVSAKCRNVLLHPLQGRHLIERSIVAGAVGFLGQFGMARKPNTPSR